MSTIDRREFCAGLAALSATSATRGVANRVRTKLPNIVFVLTDDLGWGDLDCYNPRSAIPTPNANRLAGEGMRWTDMACSDACCSPARYSILTGRYCWRSRMKTGALWGYSPNLIEEGRMTVASMLKSAGYYTAGVGKWHLGLGETSFHGDIDCAGRAAIVDCQNPHTDFSKPLRPGPVDHGFDYYFGIPASLDMAPYLYFENDHVVEQPTSSNPGSEDRTNLGRGRGVYWRPGPMAPHFDINQVLPTLTNKAVEVIEKCAANSSQPFFLYFAMPSPHTPWLPLPEYQGRSRAGKYGDYVAETDSMLGRVMQALDKSGMTDNTLIIFTSDNGADWKIQDLAQYEHRANGPWRGEKQDIWEGGHRVPYLVRWPDHIRRGSVTNVMGCQTDFMATTAAIVGAKLPANAAEDSFNLLPVLLGDTAREIRKTLVYHSADGMFGIQEGKWKLEEGLGSGGIFSQPERVEPGPGGPKGQLYDMTLDPYETSNVYQEHPDIVARLSKLLEAYRQQGYTRPI